MVNRQGFPLLLAMALLLGMTMMVGQAAVLTLPDTSTTSTMTVTIREGMSIIVPAIIDFGTVTIDATNKSVPATTTAQTVTLTGIALATGKKVRVSLQANAASFTDGTGPVFAATDVSWNASTWTQGTGTAGALSNTVFTPVATSNANPTGSMSTTNLLFTLGVHDFAAAAVLSGAQTLLITWKVESI